MYPAHTHIGRLAISGHRRGVVHSQVMSPLLSMNRTMLRRLFLISATIWMACPSEALKTETFQEALQQHAGVSRRCSCDAFLWSRTACSSPSPIGKLGERLLPVFVPESQA